MRPPNIVVNPPVRGNPRNESAEITLPGSAGALDARVADAELRSTRFLVVVSALTSVVLALVIVLGFQLLRHVLRGGGPGVLPPECVEGEDDTCEDGKTCVGRRCALVTEPKICDVGDACTRACTPSPALRCGDQGHYIAVKAAQTDICSNERVLSFLTKIEKKCGSLQSCEGRQLEEFAIEHEEFLELMTTFPGMAALHFNRGKPDASLWPMPGGKTEAHYVEGLGNFMSELGRARTVLLVALSSRDTPSDVPDPTKATDSLTLARAKAAERLVLAAARGSGSTQVLDNLDDKFKLVLLGKRKQVEASFFSDEAVVVRPITWDEKSERMLRSLIEAGDKISPRERRWRDGTLNQVVFIVPIPCTLGGTGK